MRDLQRLEAGLLRANIRRRLEKGETIGGVSVEIRHDARAMSVAGRVTLRTHEGTEDVVDTICPYSPKEDAAMAEDFIAGLCYLCAVDLACLSLAGGGAAQ